MSDFLFKKNETNILISIRNNKSSRTSATDETLVYFKGVVCVLYHRTFKQMQECQQTNDALLVYKSSS